LFGEQGPLDRQHLGLHPVVDVDLRGITCRRSDEHEEGVAAAWRRVDAIFTKLKFGNVRKSR
jgi:hypothetical protein